MRWRRSGTLAIGLLLGCAVADGGVPRGAATAHSEDVELASSPRRASASPSLLAHVPEDTPFVVASLEPLPDDVMRRYARLWNAAAAGVQKAIDDVNPRTLDPETLALLREIDGRLTREGLRQLGFQPDGRFVLYGIGLAPVLRLPLSDPAEVAALLSRIDEADRDPWPRVRSGGVELASLREDDATIVWGVVDRELVIAAYPTALEREILPLVTGTRLPTRSLHDAGWVEQMRRSQGLLPYGLGRIDLAEIVDAWAGRGPSLTTATARAWDITSDGDACDEAVRAAVVRAPEILFGATEMSGGRLAGRWVWTMDAALVADLAAVAGPAPSPRDEGVARVAVAFDVQAAIAAARHFAEDLQEVAPGCEVSSLMEQWEPPDAIAGVLGGSATLHSPGRRDEGPSWTLALGLADPARWLTAVIGPGALADWPAGRVVRMDEVLPSASVETKDARIVRTDRAVALASGRRARAHARQAARGSGRDGDALVEVALGLSGLRRAIGARELERWLSGLDPIERETAEAMLDLLGDYRARLAVEDGGLVASWRWDLGG